MRDVGGGLHAPLLSDMPITHTFDVESTDHCETPAAAYKDVAPALAHLASLLGKTKVRLLLCPPRVLVCRL